MTKRMARPIANAEFGALVLIFSASLLLGYQYLNQVDVPNFQPRFDLHHQIVQATAPSPYRYRVLAPFAAEWLINLFSVGFPAEKAFLLAYAIYDWIAILLSLVFLFFWLRIWFESEPATVGVLFVAATMPIAFQDHYFQPWSLLEPALFSLSLLAIYRRNLWLLATLVFLASLNRETAVFLPLAFLMTIQGENRQRTQSMFWFWVLLLIWAVVFFGLRYFRGNAPHVETVAGLLAQNLTPRSLFYAFLNSSLFLGGFWVFVVAGFRYAATFLKKASLVIPFYLLTVFIWGIWQEVRLLFPLYPFLLPLGLSFLYRHNEKR